MTVQSVSRRLPIGEGASGPLTLWVAIAAGSGIAVGAAASVSPTGAIALAAAIALLIWVIPRPAIILIVLIGSVFVQVITVGGVTIARICAPIALLLVVIALLRRKATLLPAAPLGWAAAYALWAVASGLWTAHLGSTLTQLASLAIALVYMLAFATLLDNRDDMNRVLYTIAFVAFAVGIYGTVASQGRAGTDTGDANFFALVEIVALPLVLALAADVRARWLRGALYGVVLVIIAAVFSSLSRGGLIALGIAVLGVIALPSRTFFRSPRQKVVVLLILAVAVFGAYKLTSQALSKRVEEVFTAQGRTGSGRLNAWRAAYTSINERPFDGLGYGGFEASANDLMLRTPGVDLSNFRLRPNGLEAHSAYIGTLADLGIPGLVLFLGLLASTITTIRRAAITASRAGALSTARLSYALLISFVGWAVASIFLSSETFRPPWIVIGIALALPKLIADETRRQRDQQAGDQL
ncbi:MAG TPA: O-antigen ligase family protein [Gaiellaceae bacterium]|nr:O-antigen ligase family protein [Gaiellaceae bacterium]